MVLSDEILPFFLRVYSHRVVVFRNMRHVYFSQRPDLLKGSLTECTPLSS